MARWLREWSILIIGMIIILGGLALTNLPSLTQSAEPAKPAEAARSPAPAPQRANGPGQNGGHAKPAAPSSHAHSADSQPAARQPTVAPAAQQPTLAPTPAPPKPTHDAAPAPAANSPSATSGQATAIPAASGAAQGDPTAGRLVFRKCQACHSMEPGKNTIGPSLSGIIDRKSGTGPNFDYSPAMKQANITWTPTTLDAYLADPQKVVPGNRMPFAGLKTEHDRKDVIAFLTAQTGQAAGATPQQPGAGPAASPPVAAAPPVSQAPQSAPNAGIGYIPDARYTLRSGIAEGRMVYIGVGGAIDNKVNPVLTATEGQVVQLTIINGEGAEHDIVFPDQDARSPRVTGRGSSTTIAFRASKAGDFVYYCSVPGHRLAGMEGQFIVTPTPPSPSTVEADISRESTDLPRPLAKREPQTVRVDLLSVEVEGRLAEGTTFGYWTFSGKVPGPFIRVRVGDTVEIHLKNSADSSMIHSVDFHAATGPGGGAASLQVDPGQEKSMTWKALVPGLYVYHCATPMVAEHIANGMYGLILVEPAGGLAKVDHEFYVMQGEIYTDAPFGQHGSQEFSVEKLLGEHPEYFVFNGSVGALSRLHPLQAKVGETVRIFFGVGGPNFTSSFHVIGEIFDRVYFLGGLLSPPLQGIQTVTVPPGGAVVTEFKLDVPGNYTLVDHALARAERGLLGILHVEGPPNTDIFNGTIMPGMGH